MRIRTVSMLLVLIVMAIFLIINWSAIAQITKVNLIYTEIDAPLGLIIVIAFAVIVALLLVYTLIQQASTLYEVKSANKEARNARALAEETEKSRIAELRIELEQKLMKIESLLDARTTELLQNSSKLEEKFNQFENNTKGEYLAQKKEVVELLSVGLKDIERQIRESLATSLPSKVEEKETEKKKDMFSDLF